MALAVPGSVGCLSVIGINIGTAKAYLLWRHPAFVHFPHCNSASQLSSSLCAVLNIGGMRPRTENSGRCCIAGP
jgi:hypothetical protein